MDPLTIGMLAVLAVLVFFMFRNSRKRQRDAAELQSKVAVGADVMTNFGVYGTVLEIDEETNKVLLETTPGTVLSVHRQTVTRVIEPTVAETAATETDDSEPEYGQRIASADSASDESSNTSGKKVED